MNKIYLTFLFIILLVSFNACALTKFAKHYSSVDGNSGSLNGSVYKTDNNSYRIIKLTGDWKKIRIKGGDLAYYNSVSESTITINSDCRKAKRNYSLKALSKSLVTGIKDKELLNRETVKVDKSQGLYSEYAASLNNEDFNLATLVYKSEKCNYDFSYSATENSFNTNLATFKNLISSFEEISAR